MRGSRSTVLVLVLLAPSAVGAADPPAPTDCDTLWRETRSLYEEGGQAAGHEKNRLLERAIESGEEAVRLCPERVEAHFWLGASYGRYAEAKGGFAAWRLVGRIRREMEAAVQLRPDYEDGDAFLALGQLDLRVPRLFGGNRRRAVERLEEGLRVVPGNFEMRLTLARAYLHSGRRVEALELLCSIRDAAGPPSPSESVRRQAEDLLRSLEPRPAPAR